MVESCLRVRALAGWVCSPEAVASSSVSRCSCSVVGSEKLQMKGAIILWDHMDLHD